MPKNPEPGPADKVKEAARALECDGNGARWDELLRKVARHKPVEPDAQA